MNIILRPALPEYLSVVLTTHTQWIADHDHDCMQLYFTRDEDQY